MLLRVSSLSLSVVFDRDCRVGFGSRGLAVRSGAFVRIGSAGPERRLPLFFVLWPQAKRLTVGEYLGSKNGVAVGFVWCWPPPRRRSVGFAVPCSKRGGTWDEHRHLLCGAGGGCE